MKILTTIRAAVAACTLGACAAPGNVAPVGEYAQASAEIRNIRGDRVGTAGLGSDDRGVSVRIDASGLPTGTYAVHIHAVGRCDPPGFESAGPHWNPSARQHGRLNPRGPHLGDLPNLEIGASGTGSVRFPVANAAMRGGGDAILDADGAAVVIHAGADDHRTDPSGNSGARIACGVLR